MTGKELNRALRDEDGHIYDVVAGTFLIAGLGAEDFTSLTPEQIDKFKDVFKTPEAFINLGGRLMVVPVEEHRPSVKDKLAAMKETQKPHTAPAKKHDREVR